MATPCLVVLKILDPVVSKKIKLGPGETGTVRIMLQEAVEITQIFSPWVLVTNRRLPSGWNATEDASSSIAIVREGLFRANKRPVATTAGRVTGRLDAMATQTRAATTSSPTPNLSKLRNVFCNSEPELGFSG